MMMHCMSEIKKFDFDQYAFDRRKLVEERLSAYLSLNDPPALWAAMRYSVLSGGKRLRALLCLAGAEAISTNPLEETLARSLPCACAIEMIHAMSLIHDDLPCMDNDDFRRGKPTNHKVYGEAMALLAGDALLMHATDILIDETPADLDTHTLLCVVRELSRAAGAKGMVAGQVDDMTSSTDAAQLQPEDAVRLSTMSDARNDIRIDVATIEKIHRRKTGALIRFSIWSGAKLSGAAELQLEGLSRFGEILGLAFQITDDLLDVTGDRQTLGKTPGKDEAAKKLTWVSVFGLDGARNRLSELEAEGEQLLSSLALQSGSIPALGSLLKYAIHRIN
jgi:geranylgeranyl diphosphate synthase type II